MPADTATAKRGIELRIWAETAFMGLGDFHAALARLREAETLARALPQRWYLGRVRSRMTYQLGSIGDLQGAVAAGKRRSSFNVTTRTSGCAGGLMSWCRARITVSATSAARST